MMETRKKRLAVVSGLYDGGTEIAMVRLLERLDYRNVDVTLITQDQSGPIESRIPAHVHVVHLDFSSDAARTWALNDFDGLSSAKRAASRLGRKILTLASSERHNRLWDAAVRGIANIPDEEFDLVMDFKGYGTITTAIGARLHAAKRATWLHDDRMEWLQYSLPYLSRYDKVFCVSQAVKDSFTAKAPQYADKAEVMYNLVDVDAIRSKATMELTDPRFTGSNIILTMGRLEPQKGLDIAIRAAALMRDRGVDFHWYVLGAGNYRAEYERLIAQNNLESCFRLLGKVDNPYPYIRKADIYVQPSRYEGLSLAVQEARILGRPVAASNITSNKEQITDGRNGLLFTLDERDMADAVSKLLEDHAMQRRFHEACERESFDFSDQLNKLWELMR